MDRKDLFDLDYGITIAVEVLVAAMGMQAENQERLRRGESIAYPEKAFQDLITEKGIHHNAVMTRWYGN